MMRLPLVTIILPNSLRINTLTSLFEIDFSIRRIKALLLSDTKTIVRDLFNKARNPPTSVNQKYKFDITTDFSKSFHGCFVISLLDWSDEFINTEIYFDRID